MQQPLQLQAQAHPAWDGLGHMSNPVASHGGGGGGTEAHQLPSPTLTNPDMVLPTDGTTYGINPQPKIKPGQPNSTYTHNETRQGADVRMSAAVLGGGGIENNGNEFNSQYGFANSGDKRGLMSRKMMLARSQSGLPSMNNKDEYGNHFGDFDGAYGHNQSGGIGVALPLPPTVDNTPATLLAPAAVAKQRTSSGSSYNSDDLKAAQQFLSKYGPNNADAADDESVNGKDDDVRRRSGEIGFSSAASIAENDLDSRRREQKIEEQNSAMLSQRAEQILANAKKRLNLMEGNLRGARDLVAPLTAANLKRATSLGSSNLSSVQLNARSRFMPDGYRHETAGSPAIPQHTRILHSQASSPAIGRDYRMGYTYSAAHARGYSETEVPGQTAQSLSRQSSLARQGRFPIRVSDGSADAKRILRSSRSYDTLSNRFSYQRPPSEGRGLQKNSPDSNLDTLPEDEGYGHQSQPPDTQAVQTGYGLGLYGPQSAVEEGPYGGRTLWRSQSVADEMRGFHEHQYSQYSQPFVSSYRQYWHQRQHTETFRSTSSAADYRQPSAYGYSPEPYARSTSAASDLRFQMNSLKDRISSLRDRAREDSLRRQSMQSLRTPSPLNNAAQDAPEMYYSQSEENETPLVDSNAGFGPSSNGNVSHDRVSGEDRNAYSAPLSQGQWNENPEHDYAEQNRQVDWRHRPSASPPRPSTARHDPQYQDEDYPLRTSTGGNGAAESQHQRSLAQHQRNLSADSHDSYDDYAAAEDEQADEDLTYDNNPSQAFEEYLEENDEYHDDEVTNDTESDSVYEDAPSSPPKDIVAHEDRADAFDYQQFYLHSAMAAYGNHRERSNSYSTEEESEASSTETARAPDQAGNTNYDETDYGDEEIDFFDPDATPRRFPPPTPETPEQLREIERKNIALLHQRTLSSDSVSTVTSFATAAEARETSPSPATTLRKIAAGGAALKADARRRRRSPVPPFPAHPAANSSSAPHHDLDDDVSSERADSGVGFTGRRGKLAAAPPQGIALPQDPVSVAVNALLRPEKAALGLREKAMVFEVMEALKKVVGGLQDRGEGQSRPDGTTAGIDDLRERMAKARKMLEGLEGGKSAGGRAAGRPGTA